LVYDDINKNTATKIMEMYEMVLGFIFLIQKYAVALGMLNARKNALAI
jgi:hypothetical protein